MSTYLLPNELWILIFERILHTHLLPSSISTFVDELELLSDRRDGGAGSLAALKQQLAHKTILCLVCRYFCTLACGIGANLVLVNRYTEIRKLASLKLSKARRLEFNRPIPTEPIFNTNLMALEVLYFCQWGHWSGVDLPALFDLVTNLRALRFGFGPVGCIATWAEQRSYVAFQHPVFMNLTHLSFELPSRRHLEKTHMPLLKFLSLQFRRTECVDGQHRVEDTPLPKGAVVGILIPWTCPRLVSLELDGDIDEIALPIFLPFLQWHAHQVTHLQEGLRLVRRDLTTYPIHLVERFPNLNMYRALYMRAYGIQDMDAAGGVILTSTSTFDARIAEEAALQGSSIRARDAGTTKYITVLTDPASFVLAGYRRDLSLAYALVPTSMYTLLRFMLTTSSQEIGQAVDDGPPTRHFRESLSIIARSRSSKLEDVGMKRLLLEVIDEFNQAGIVVVDRFGVPVDEVSIAPLPRKSEGAMGYSTKRTIVSKIVPKFISSLKKIISQ